MALKNVEFISAEKLEGRHLESYDLYSGRSRVFLSLSAQFYVAFLQDDVLEVVADDTERALLGNTPTP